MPRRDREGTRSEKAAREVSGRDAPASEAEAGSGASEREEREHRVEGEPSHAEDIAPDRVEPSEPYEAPRRSGRGLGGLVRRRRAALKVDDEVAVAELLWQLRRAPWIAVVDAERHFHGVVTRTDVLERALEAKDRKVRVRELMRDAPAVRRDASPELAARALVKERAHSLPVVDDEGRFVGMLRDDEVLASMLKRSSRPAPRAPGVFAVPVEELMTREPVTLDADTTVEGAAGTLLGSGVRHLPVVDDDGKVVGIVSERDVRERLGTDPREWFRGPADALEDEVANVMTPDPIVIREGTPLADALDVFANERVGAVPVVDDDDRLVGILSYVDVLRWIRERFERAEEPAGPPFKM